MTLAARRAGGDSGLASATVIIIVAAAGLLLLALLTAAGSAGQPAATSACTLPAASQPRPSAAATRSIPPGYLGLFQQAGHKYGVPWPVLAAIGEVESNFGANDGPSTAGALGPMQFLPSTWAQYGGGGDIMSPADAIPAAARKLAADGVTAGNVPAAIFAYNHSAGYVSQVLSLANGYAVGGFTVSSGQHNVCTAATVSQAPGTIAAQIVSYALAQLGKPYIWGGTGPGGFDCSGLIFAAYRSVGITLPRTTFGMWDLPAHVLEKEARAGDIVLFNMGPGSSPDHPGHAGLVIGPGRMVIANCTDCGPITTADYGTYPALVGFVRPLADPAITAQLIHH